MLEASLFGDLGKVFERRLRRTAIRVKVVGARGSRGASVLLESWARAMAARVAGSMLGRIWRKARTLFGVVWMNVDSGRVDGRWA
jgi:hypothetical protein